MRGSCRPSNTRDRTGKVHTPAELSFLFIYLFLSSVLVNNVCNECYSAAVLASKQLCVT